jgi:hypothetical protein
MRVLVFSAVLLTVSHMLPAAAADNVFLITLDGLRWEELYTGADETLINDAAFTENPEAVAAQFWRDTPQARRQALMPFFWHTIAEQGVLYGNRLLGSNVNVGNAEWFSYPGYNEILTGAADADITSNAKVPNKNITVLEWINQQTGFEGKVAAFASWDVFPFIINENRSGVPVNAGFDGANPVINERESWLNTLQSQTPSPWAAVRLDVFTHHYALEYLAHSTPRLLYISYGETDDYAHDAEYHHYLESAHRADQFISDLWDWAQSHPQYRDNTTFVITTDHGRGSGAQWTDHEAGIEGADEIWIALLGTGIPPLSEVAGGAALGQNQIAATVASLLGLRYSEAQIEGKEQGRAVGAPLAIVGGQKPE